MVPTMFVSQRQELCQRLEGRFESFDGSQKDSSSTRLNGDGNGLLEGWVADAVGEIAIARG